MGGTIMNIVSVGAGKLGYSIAELLSKEEYDIVVLRSTKIGVEK